MIVDYFYHEEIRGTENTGERNLLSNSKISERKYFVSDNAEDFEKHALIFMGNALGGTVEQVDIEE